MRLDRTGHQITGDHPAGPTVDDDQVEHLAARQHRDPAGRFLLRERVIRAQQQLLAGLPARVERPRDERPAERSVREQAAVLARERYALRDGVIDDPRGQLGQAIDVRLAGAKVAALERVVEEALDAVAVVAIVLRRVDAALRGDAVGAPR
jgi:hypothetical protein